MRRSNQCFAQYIIEGHIMRSVNLLLNRLSPLAKSLISQGKIRAAIMISNLSPLDKALLMKYFKE